MESRNRSAETIFLQRKKSRKHLEHRKVAETIGLPKNEFDQDSKQQEKISQDAVNSAQNEQATRPKQMRRPWPQVPEEGEDKKLKKQLR